MIMLGTGIHQKRNLELKAYFEGRMQRDLYDAVEKDSFRPV